MSKKLGAPAVVHGKSDKSQGEWMRSEMKDFARKAHSNQGQMGKGSKRRIENTKLISDNWDSINWSSKKKG